MHDTENTFAEAKEACHKDLKEKANVNQTLLDTAIESAVDTVTALTKPFERYLGEEKTFEIVYAGNYVTEVE